MFAANDGRLYPTKEQVRQANHKYAATFTAYTEIQPIHTTADTQRSILDKTA